MIAHGEELSFLKKYDQFRSLGFGSLISLLVSAWAYPSG